MSNRKAPVSGKRASENPLFPRVPVVPGNNDGNMRETPIVVPAPPLSLRGGNNGNTGTSYFTGQQGVFLQALAEGLSVRKSVLAAGTGTTSVYRWRDADPAFRRAWDEALAILPDRVRDALVEEAIDGRPILDAEGREIGRQRNARLLERLGEQHGLLPSARPTVAVQVNNNNEPDPAKDFAELRAAWLRRYEARKARERGEVIEAEPVPDDACDLI